MRSATDARRGDAGTPRLAWPDAVRLLATAAIFLFHFFPEFLRLSGTQGGGFERIVGKSFNDWGLSAFVVLSGFSLTLSCLTAARPYRDYAARRLVRLYAPYWTVAVPITALGFAMGVAGLDELWKVPIWLLGLGVVSESTYLPISNAWWFVSLALQISLLAPLVVWVYRRYGAFVATLGMLAVQAATLGVIYFAGRGWQYLDQGFVLARLAEVVAGVLAACILVKRRDGGSIRAELGGLAALLVAVPFLYSIPHYHFIPWDAPFVLALVFAACALWAPAGGRQVRWLAVAAAYTYCFYLCHAPVTKYTLEALFGRGVSGLAATFVLSLAASVVVTWVAEAASRRYTTRLVRALVYALLRVRPARATRAGG